MSETSQPLDHPFTRSTVEGNFQSYEGNLGRILDPVRAAALRIAVDAVAAEWNPGALEPFQHTEEVLRVAKAFERYLAGDDD